MKAKRKLIIFILSFLLFSGTVYSQPLGFIEPECGIVPNTSYSYENFNIGSHGWGYRLFYNGIKIWEAYDFLGGNVLAELKFIPGNKKDLFHFFIIRENLPE
jgi:hypothetical protein